MRSKTLLLVLALVFAACGGGANTWNSAAGTTPPPGGSPTPVDTISPSVPDGVTATPGSNEISLTWIASTDNVGTTGYAVRRDGNPVATTAAISYIDTGLLASTTYSYTISAADAAGNTSPQTTPVAATTQASGTPTALAQVAASLAPGQWAVLTTIGFNNGSLLVTPKNGDPITQYADKALWDPIRRRFYFLGGSNQSSNQSDLNKFLIYSDSTNSWTQGVNPSPCGGSGCPLGHGYEHSTINQATGELYFRPYNSSQVYRYNPSTGAWSRIADLPMSSMQVAGALEWFPERNELVFVDGDFGIWAYTPSSNQWNQRAHTNNGSGGGLPKLPMRAYHNIAHYNPVHKMMLLGGYNLYRYSSDGTFTPLAATPFPVAVAEAVVTVAPLSGKYLVLGNGNRFHEYDITTDTWTAKSAASMPPLWGGGSGGVPGEVFDTIGAPISTHGVVMYINYAFGNSKIYIYKP